MGWVWVGLMLDSWLLRDDTGSAFFRAPEVPAQELLLLCEKMLCLANPTAVLSGPRLLSGLLLPSAPFQTTQRCWLDQPKQAKR